MCKKPRFRTPFDSQHAEICNAALLSYFLITLREIKLVTLLVTFEILGLCGNIVSAGHKYSLCNTENSQESVVMQSSKKQKAFFEFFFSIPKF